MEENKVVENPTVEEVKKEENNATSQALLPKKTLKQKHLKRRNSIKTRDLTKLHVRKLLKNTKKELLQLIVLPKLLKVVKE